MVNGALTKSPYAAARSNSLAKALAGPRTASFMAADMFSPDPDAPAPGRARSAARARVLEDITRVFLADADRDPRAAATFSEIAAGLIPHVGRGAAVTIARMLAGRGDVPQPVLAALAAHGLKPKGTGDAAASPADISVEAGAASSATRDDEVDAIARADGAPAHNFLDADPDARQQIIADAMRHAALDAGPELRRRLDSVAALALERAADRRDRDDAILILARTLAIEPRHLARLADDVHGDGLAIILKAAALDDDGATRIFIGVGPPAARSGAGLRAAIRQFQTISRAGAVRLLAMMMEQPWTPRASIGGESTRTSGEPRPRAAVVATFSPSFDRVTQARSPNAGAHSPFANRKG